jgi:hypothetical protein
VPWIVACRCDEGRHWNGPLMLFSAWLWAVSQTGPALIGPGQAWPSPKLLTAYGPARGFESRSWAVKPRPHSDDKFIMIVAPRPGCSTSFPYPVCTCKYNILFLFNFHNDHSLGGERITTKHHSRLISVTENRSKWSVERKNMASYAFSRRRNNLRNLQQAIRRAFWRRLP